MKRTYVPIYQDKRQNSQIYFDYETNEFFTTPPQKNSSLPYLSGFAGIVFYVFFKNASLDIGLNPFTVVLLSIILGFILGFITVKLFKNAINKGLKTKKILLTPTVDQVKNYIIEGKKQSKTLYFMSIFLLLLSLLCSLILLIMPNSVLFNIMNPMIWAVLILVIWAVRPIKKFQVYKQLKNGLLA